MAVDTTHVYQLGREILQKRYNEILDEKVNMEVLSFIMTLKNDVRLYALSTKDQVEKLWDLIRETEGVTDFFMSSLGEFFFKLNYTPAEISIVRKQITEAYSAFNVRGSAIDSDSLDRLPSGDGLFSLLERNPWLILLYVWETVPLTDLGVTDGEATNTR